jgi:hypothetical protein
MPEKKVSPASAFLPVVHCLSPASAFRHQGSPVHGSIRHCPAMPPMSMMRNENTAAEWKDVAYMGMNLRSLYSPVIFFLFSPNEKYFQQVITLMMP